MEGHPPAKSRVGECSQRQVGTFWLTRPLVRAAVQRSPCQQPAHVSARKRTGAVSRPLDGDLPGPLADPCTEDLLALPLSSSPWRRYGGGCDGDDTEDAPGGGDGADEPASAGEIPWGTG